MDRKMRSERDSMGEVAVPEESLYGASTMRALTNFPISDLRFGRSFIRALCLIKHCGAIVNGEDGVLSEALAEAIVQSAARCASGEFDSDFVVDIFQTGSGTSTNMNANEVIANLAIEKLGGVRGERSLVHPNDHVNHGMSSNDCIPTAIHVAALLDIKEKLEPALSALEGSLRERAAAFMPVIKTGRTHLQDATPIRLGQEFIGYAGQVERALVRLAHARERLSSVALGGTAVGTGIGTRADFAARVLALLSEKTGLTLNETSNHFQAQSTIDEIVEASGILRTIAVSLLKIANDIRFLGSGPRAGYGELVLPEVQPGSSIMPGKVNPVIAESLSMVCARVIGNDATIVIAGQSGNFELNVMLPVAGYCLLQSIGLLASSAHNFKVRLVDGLKATSRGPELLENGLSLATALVGEIGYDEAAAVAHEAYLSGATVRQVVLKRALIDPVKLDELLAPESMV